MGSVLEAVERLQVLRSEASSRRASELIFRPSRNEDCVGSGEVLGEAHLSCLPGIIWRLLCSSGIVNQFLDHPNLMIHFLHVGFEGREALVQLVAEWGPCG